LGIIGFIVSFWHSALLPLLQRQQAVLSRMGDVLERNMAYNA
jgi:hypothetical protein